MPYETEELKLHHISTDAIGWTSQQSSSRRRWMDVVSQDLSGIAMPLADAVSIIAHNRIAWRAFVHTMKFKLEKNSDSLYSSCIQRMQHFSPISAHPLAVVCAACVGTENHILHNRTCSYVTSAQCNSEAGCEVHSSILKL